MCWSSLKSNHLFCILTCCLSCICKLDHTGKVIGLFVKEHESRYKLSGKGGGREKNNASFPNFICQTPEYQFCYFFCKKNIFSIFLDFIIFLEKVMCCLFWLWFTHHYQTSFTKRRAGVRLWPERLSYCELFLSFFHPK